MTQSDGPDGNPDVLPTTDQFDEASLFSRPRSASRLVANYTSDDAVKADVLELPNEFTETSTLLQCLRETQIEPEKTTLLIIEAVTSRAKSANSAKPIIKHV